MRWSQVCEETWAEVASPVPREGAGFLWTEALPSAAQGAQSQKQNPCNHILALPPPCSVSLGRSSLLTGPWFAHLYCQGCFFIPCAVGYGTMTVGQEASRKGTPWRFLFCSLVSWGQESQRSQGRAFVPPPLPQPSILGLATFESRSKAPSPCCFLVV